MGKFPTGIRWGKRRIGTPALVLILSIIFIAVGFSTGYFEEKQIAITPNGVEVFHEQARTALGLKAEDVTVGGRLCEVVEPVYAQLKCVVGNQDQILKVSESVDAIGPKINNPGDFLELVDFTIPEWNTEIGQVCTKPKLESTEGEAWRFDWKKFNDFYSDEDIKALICSDCEFPTNVIIEDENGDLTWYYGTPTLLTYDTQRADYVSSGVLKPPTNTKYIYIFRLNVGGSEAWGELCYLNPWAVKKIEPSDPGDWEMEIYVTSKYLEYSVPGSLGPYRVAGSFGCEAPDIISMLRTINDASAIGSGPLTLAAGLSDDEAKPYITNSRNIGGGTYVLGVDYDSALDSARATDSSDVKVAASKLAEGEAVQWLQLYRNTNIKYDTSVASAVVPKTFNGESVICDQARNRILDFQELPLTDYQEQFNLCYAIPGNVIIDKSDDPDYFFSCSESYCRQFGTPAGKPVWDPGNFRCVGQDAPVDATECTADTQCEPQLPVTVRTEDGAIKFTGDCQSGKCVVLEEVLTCKPGDQTAVALCSSQGEWVDLPSTVSNCPINSCCRGDPRFFDQECSTGYECCIENAATTGNCQQSCIDVVVDLPPPSILDIGGNILSDTTGMSEGEGKFLSLIILAIIVVVTFYVVIYLIFRTGGRGRSNDIDLQTLLALRGMV